ncbi:D-amino-acid oxidase [Planctomycetia bacterium]|nr:D-amino-acid oxidase [Planctomycetia bacterium]
MPDIVLIGGGVIGLSIAFELVTRGASVRVLDQGPLGQESSWAGAGMITPGDPAGANSPDTRLRAESFVLWPDWAARLREESGIDTGFARCGGIEFSPDRSASEIAAVAAKFQSEGVRAELIGARELRELEPNLNPELGDAVHLPDYCQVRNPRLLKALLAACTARGAELSPGSPVIGFERSGSRVTSIRTPAETISAGQFVVCSGAWSQSVLAQVGCTIPVVPVRGQIVLLEALPLPTRRILEVGSRYIVPRADGRLLIGSTEEHVGFEKRNTAEAVAELIHFGSELVPSLKAARFERCWSGLRPGSPNGRPYLGRVPNTDNLFVAAGHFRAGLMLSPITAVLLRQMLLRETPSLVLDELLQPR